MRCLFLCKNRNDSYGVSFGLVNSAAFVANTLKAIGVEAEVRTVRDANEIDRVVTHYNPTHVYVEALWVAADKFRELLSIRRHQRRQWIVRVHSKAPFIANEGIAFPLLMQYRSVAWEFNDFHVSCNSTEFNESLLAATGIRSIYLPNIYTPPRYPRDECRGHKPHGYIDIGCFGAIRPLKNHLNQALAAIAYARLIGKHLRFHVNGSRNEQNGEQVLKNLRALFSGSAGHRLVEHAWHPHEGFCRLIRSMDLGMQVSLSETFNIVAADFVAMDVPIITSRDIDWMPAELCADPNIVSSMVKRLTTAAEHAKKAVHALHSWNHAATRIWLQHLGAA